MNPNANPNESCPFEFNFDAATFKVGDTVSYRVKSLAGFPFVGTLKAVHDDYVELVDQGEPDRVVRASRESRPVVDE
jgi:hypothetical protein